MPDLKVMRTAAEQSLAEAFAGARGKLPGGGAVKSLRESAFHAFEAKGLPHRRVEEWKYTDLRTLMRDAKPLASPPDAAAKLKAKSAGAFLAALKPRRIVIVDGVFSAELSDLSEPETGLWVGSLAEALAKGDPTVVERLGRASPLKDDAAFALNTAMMGDGVVISVSSATAISRPLHLVFVTTPDRPVSLFTRSLISIGALASATVIESHEGPDGVDHQLNHAIDLAVGEEATLHHIKVGMDGDRTLHVATLVAQIAASAQVNEFIFTLGSVVTRNQIAVHMGGTGIHAGIRGATLLKGRQHADNTLVIDHASYRCQSRELFKSVLDGESRSVFQGKIIVQPSGEKTEAKMATHALLLSEGAEADAKPELEIFNDDVVCGHGATAGALDDDLLFYLRARGIPQKEAEALMVEAFVGDVVEAVESEALRETLMDLARAWLAART